MTFAFYGATDQGRARSNNEDSFLIKPELQLAIIADGMGGHNGGEVASKMAVEAAASSVRLFRDNVQTAIFGKINPNFSDAANVLASSLRLANQMVYEAGRRKPELKGMGTTIDAMQVCGKKVAVAHVGDSRVYQISNGQIRALTQDHSWVAEQVRAGLLKAEDAENSPMKHILVRALGNEENIEVDLIEIDFNPGDILLAATDGLMKMVSDPLILEIVTSYKTPQEAVHALIQRANEAGGADNVTIVMFSNAA